MTNNVDLVRKYSDGVLSYSDIAALTGLHRNTVHRIVAANNLPKRPKGGAAGKMTGNKNPAYSGGRRILPNGYVQLLCEYTHPQRPKSGYMAEHRLVMEDKLGRYLQRGEIVDHIDGLRLHNHPDNLRLFSSNAEHLKATLTGRKKNWSKEGLSRLSLTPDQRKHLPRINMTRQMIVSGDFLTLQILLAALKLGIGSPFLSGSFHHLEKKQIDWNSRTNLERALGDLYARWGWDQIP